MKTFMLVCLLIAPLLAMGDHPGMSPSIQEVKKQHESKLLSMPGVVSVGIGLGPEGREAIVVGLNSQNQETAAKIPDTIEGFPVHIQFIGNIQAQ